MSQENVERLRPLYEAWGRGAYEEGLDVLDERIEWRAAGEIPGHGGIVYGRPAAAKYLVEWRQTWETYSVEVERFVDLGDEVLALARERGCGRGSGAVVETKFAQLWTMHEGKAVRMQEWRTWEEALSALGVDLSGRENVETVRRMYDAYARSDFGACLSYFDPEVEFSQPAGEPGGGTYHGRDGVIEAMRKWVGAWDDYRVEVHGLTALGDHVLARTRHHGRGRGSGVQVQQEIFQLMTLRPDRIVRMRMYYDEAEALEAAGSPESPN